nr:hypothetical protein [Oryzomonas rubra]
MRVEVEVVLVAGDRHLGVGIEIFVVDVEVEVVLEFEIRPAMVAIPSIITVAATPATPSSLLLISLILPIMWLFGVCTPIQISRTNKKIYTIRFVFFLRILGQKMT